VPGARPDSRDREKAQQQREQQQGDFDIDDQEVCVERYK